MPNNTYQTVWNANLNALPQNERGYYKLSQIAAPNRQSVGEPYFRVLNVIGNTVSPNTGHPWQTTNISNISFSGQEVPSGNINGTNKNFTLAHGTIDPATLTIIINGDPLTNNIDYTVSGATNQNITFTNAPGNILIPNANTLQMYAYYAYGI